MLRSTTYTVAEVAELLQCTPETVRGYVARGVINAAPRLSDKAQWRIPSQEVEVLTQGTAMASRYDEKRKQWFSDIAFRHPDGRRERFRIDSPVNTRLGCDNNERKIRESIADGTFRRFEPTTVREFSRDFMTWARNNLKPSTVQTYAKILRNNLIPFFGALKLSCVTPEQIERYKSARASAAKPASPKTISNELLCLSSVLRLAVEFGHLAHAPKIRRPKLPRIQDRAYRWLTQDEADKLLAVDSSYRTMMVIALNTGLRLGELQALAWEQVDLKAGRLVVSRNFAGDVVGTPKGGRNRVVPLNAQALAALEDHPRRLHCDLVFNTGTGRMVSQSDASKGLWRACDTAGIERCGWHVLRHTFASWLVQRGVVLRAVQELLGHATITVTERYAHLSPDVSSEAVRALDRCIRGQ